jgi:hypothetical protein
MTRSLPGHRGGYGALRRALAVVIGVTLPLSGCVHTFYSTKVAIVTQTAQVGSGAPVRAHLHDGSIVVFPEGAVGTDAGMTGDGRKYSFGLGDSIAVGGVVQDSILFIEIYQRKTKVGLSVLVSTLATLAAPIAGIGLAMLGCVMISDDCGFGAMADFREE